MKIFIVIFFKPVPNFRVLCLLLLSYFSNFCTTLFLSFFFVKFSHNCFLNFLSKFCRNFLWFFRYIFVIFKNWVLFDVGQPTPFGTLAMESAKKGFAKSKMDNKMYCKCPKVILTFTVLFRNKSIWKVVQFNREVQAFVTPKFITRSKKGWKERSQDVPTCN